jgi:lipopolysaccharide transport system permease protein
MSWRSAPVAATPEAAGALDADGTTPEEPVLILEPGRADQNYWMDLWRYRELFLTMAWRDVAVRYKQTVIGATWAVIRPVLTMAILTLVFGRIARLPSEGDAPYSLMVFAAILPWTLFSSALTDAANSLIANANLIGKVYFPRLIIPAATMVTALVDFMISLAIVGVMMAYYRYAPSWHILLLPLFTVLALLASLGPGLWATALNVKYRDFRYVIPFAVQLGLYISPVGFSSRMVPEKWRLLYSLNPMVGVIDGFRWCILGESSPLDVRALLVSLLVIGLLLWLGVSAFRRTERTFADLV